MSKDLKPSKKTVELKDSARPSRIRREPVPSESPAERARSAWWHSDEWELRIAIIGIVVFALGINAVGFLLSQVLLH